MHRRRTCCKVKHFNSNSDGDIIIPIIVIVKGKTIAKRFQVKN